MRTLLQGPSGPPDDVEVSVELIRKDRDMEHSLDYQLDGPAKAFFVYTTLTTICDV